MTARLTWTRASTGPEGPVRLSAGPYELVSYSPDAFSPDGGWHVFKDGVLVKDGIHFLINAKILAQQLADREGA